MAKKKEVNAEEGRNAAPLTAAESKEYQAALARIGSRKSAGFAYLIEMVEGKKDLVKGLVFAHEVDKTAMVINLLAQLYKSPSERMLLMLRLMPWVKSDD